MHRPVCSFLMVAVVAFPLGAQRARQPVIGATSAPVLTISGKRFRDLNRNGALDAYEDWRLSSSARATDLVGRMTLPEKVGAAVHGTAPVAGGPMSSGPAYDTLAAAAIILTSNVNSLITRMAIAPSEMAVQGNALQRIAERGRLGIPLTFSSDPRSHFQGIAGASTRASGFSQWPGDTRLRSAGRSVAGQALRERRSRRVSRRRHPHGPLSAGGSRDGTALVPDLGHVR